MSKNSTLENLKKNIKGYSALASAMVASAGVANADIIVKDTAVTLINNGDSFEIDLNCDGVTDATVTLNKNSNIYGPQGYGGAIEFKNIRSASLSLMGGASAVYTSTASGTGLYAGGLFGEDKKVEKNFGSSYGLGWRSNGGLIGYALSENVYFKKVGSYSATSTGETPPPWAATSQTFSSGTISYFKQKGAWGKGVSPAKYFGLRMEVASGDTVYGWVKVRSLDKSGTGEKLWELKIDGYALNETANEAIFTGRVNGYADEAFEVTAYDTTDNDNSSDLGVSFNLPNMHVNTGEIRLFAVPVGGDTLDACQDAWGLLQSADYATVSVDADTSMIGTNLNDSLYYANFDGVNDINGNPVVNGVEYFVYVYTKGSYDAILNSTGANQSTLIKSSNSVLLLGVAEPVASLAAVDNADNNDASDLLVTFNESADASKQNNYKVFIVKEDSAAAFDLAAAQAVASGNYKNVASTANNAMKSVTYAVGDKDIDGDDIAFCTPYRVFVMSEANGTTADRDILSTDSIYVNLKDITAPAVNTVGLDVWDTPDDHGFDLRYEFNSPADVDGIKEYWVIAVPTADMPITVEDAKATTLANHRIEREDGSGKYAALFESTKDYNGDPIQNGVEYTIVVLSVTDDVCHDRCDIVSAAQTITLQTVIPAAVDNMTIVASDVADDRSPSDMEVTFDAPSSQAGIGEYKVIVVNQSFAQGFIINDQFGTAMAFSAGFATTTIPKDDAATSYTTRLDPSHLDENGNPIQNYKAYNVYILSVGDQSLSFVNTISDTSAAVILRDYTGVDDLDNNLAGKINISSFGGQVRILMDPSLTNGRVFVHNTVGQVIKSTQIHNRELLINDIPERGVYFVTVLVGEDKVTKKVFIE